MSSNYFLSSLMVKKRMAHRITSETYNTTALDSSRVPAGVRLDETVPERVSLMQFQEADLTVPARRGGDAVRDAHLRARGGDGPVHAHEDPRDAARRGRVQGGADEIFELRVNEM